MSSEFDDLNTHDSNSNEIKQMSTEIFADDGSYK